MRANETERISIEVRRDFERGEKPAHLVDNGSLGLDSLNGEVGSSDLLSDSTSLSLLDVGLTNLIRVRTRQKRKLDQLSSFFLSPIPR